jgi:ribonuclease P protein component
MVFAPVWRPRVDARLWQHGVPADASDSVRDGRDFPVQALFNMDRLKRRADFRAAAAGVRATGDAFVLQSLRRADEDGVRVGFTVSRQVGNAVERNRVRRRLRELVRLANPGGLLDGHDYVLVGRRAALQSPFGDMIREFDTTLTRVHVREAEGTGAGRQRPLHEAGSTAPGTRSRARMHRTQPPEH